MAPRKVRAIASLLKGQSVNEAEAQLLLQPRRAAEPLLKLLRSAVANAKNNQKVSAGGLYIQSIRVDMGPMLKRIMPRARGSAAPIQKKMSHVILVLDSREKPIKERFTISHEKKEKIARARTEKSERPKKEELLSRVAKEKPGFFKKFFRRKAV